MPSLLPFFIATELLSYTNVVTLLGKLLKNIMRPVFNVPGEGSYALIMGIISGYPTGAKIISKFREEDICTKEEGERLLAFTNNSGPLFIIGTVGVAFFGDTRTGILLFITHILACLTVGFLFRFWKRTANRDGDSWQSKACQESPSLLAKKTANLSNLGEVLGSSISNSINTIVMIGGFIVLFSVILSILNQSNILEYISKLISPILNVFGVSDAFVTSILSGLLELTNGVKQASFIVTRYVSINVIICSFLLGFGGICVLFQVLSITSKSDISIKPYVIGKSLHGTIAAIYTYLLLNCTNFFNLDLEPVFINSSERLSLMHPSYQNVYWGLLVLILLIFVYWKLFRKKFVFFKSTSKF